MITGSPLEKRYFKNKNVYFIYTLVVDIFNPH